MYLFMQQIFLNGKVIVCLAVYFVLKIQQEIEMAFAFRELTAWWELSGKDEWVKKGVMTQKENLTLFRRLKGGDCGQEFVLEKQEFF